MSVLNGEMANHIKRATLFFAIILLVPLIVGFIDSWSAALGFILFLLGIPVTLVVLATGTIVGLAKAAKLPLEDGDRRNRAFAVGVILLLFAATILGALPSLRIGSFIGSFSRLMVNHRHYEAIIAKANKTRQSVWYEDDGAITYSTDLGPPIRVAFNPAGMLDNWSGIIYDPTGDVMLANGFDPKTGKFFAPERVTKIFGGDLVGCRHLWGSYYDCSFT